MYCVRRQGDDLFAWILSLESARLTFPGRGKIDSSRVGTRKHTFVAADALLSLPNVATAGRERWQNAKRLHNIHAYHSY